MEAEAAAAEITDGDRESFLARLQIGKKPVGTNVHTSHCCSKHGCKYGDEDCPVVSHGAMQLCLCEECDTDIILYKMNEGPAEAYARSVVKMDLERGNSVLVNGEELLLEKLGTKTATKAQYADLVWIIKSAYLAGASQT
jgi:hypothetical protein